MIKIPDELQGRVTVDLWPTTGHLLGISRSSVYAAAARGEVPTLRLGGRYRVPVAGLLDLLGITAPSD